MMEPRELQVVRDSDISCHCDAILCYFVGTYNVRLWPRQHAYRCAVIPFVVIAGRKVHTRI